MRAHCLAAPVALCVVAAVLCATASAEINVQGWYRMGEDDGIVDGSPAAAILAATIGTDAVKVGSGGSFTTDTPGPGSTYALTFSGVESSGTSYWVDPTPYNFGVTNNWGMEAWIKLGNDYTGQVKTIYSNGGWACGMQVSNNQWQGFQTIAPSLLGQWVHTAFVIEDERVTRYINGRELYTSDDTRIMKGTPLWPGVPSSPYETALWIGRANAHSSGFDGAIDEVRVFNFEEGQFAVTDLNLEVAAPVRVGGAGALGDHVLPGDGSTKVIYQQGREITVNGVGTGVIYAGTQDTTLFEGAPDANYGGDELITWDGRKSGAPEAKQLLLRFDDIFGSEAHQIPYGAEIASALLHTTAADAAGGSGRLSMILNVDWDEDTATWNDPGAGDNGTPGIQNDGADCAGGWQPDAAGGGMNIDVKNYGGAPVAWAAGSPNYGWVVYPNDYNEANGIDHYSSEAADMASRPMLTIVYFSPTEIYSWLNIEGYYTCEIDADSLLSDRLLAGDGAGLTSILDLSGATLEVQLLTGALDAGDAWQLVVADRIVGDFSQIILPDIAGIEWDTSGLAAGGDGYLRVVGGEIPEPATLSLVLIGAMGLITRRKRK